MNWQLHSVPSGLQSACRQCSNDQVSMMARMDHRQIDKYWTWLRRRDKHVSISIKRRPPFLFRGPASVDMRGNGCYPSPPCELGYSRLRIKPFRRLITQDSTSCADSPMKAQRFSQLCAIGGSQKGGTVLRQKSWGLFFKCHQLMQEATQSSTSITEITQPQKSVCLLLSFSGQIPKTKENVHFRILYLRLAGHWWELKNKQIFNKESRHETRRPLAKAFSSKIWEWRSCKQRSPKTLPEGQQSPKIAPRLANMPQHSPDRTWADVVPTELHVAPTWTQHGPTWIQHSSAVNAAPTWSHDSCWQIFKPGWRSRPVASAPRIKFYNKILQKGFTKRLDTKVPQKIPYSASKVPEKVLDQCFI